MFDKLKSLFKKPEVKPVESKPEVAETKEKPKRKPRIKKSLPTLSAKEIATQNDEPYVAVTNVLVDPNDVNSGQMELDWNQKFVYNLIRAGYQHKKTDTETDIVDRWFQQVCTNISQEVQEQFEADPDNRPVKPTTNTKKSK